MQLVITIAITKLCNSEFLVCAVDTEDMEPVHGAVVSAAHFILKKPVDVLDMLTDAEHTLWAISALIFVPDSFKQVNH